MPRLAPYGLLASGMVGRTIRVEAAAPGEPTYTDARAIYLATGQDRNGDRTAIAIQAALIAAGSLDAGIMRQLNGRPGAARRYLAVEGWRALATVGGQLPSVGVVVAARGMEAISKSPQESLGLALSRAPVPDLPDTFGILRPRRVLAARPGENAGAPTRSDLSARKLPSEQLRKLDEDEETESAPKVLKLFETPFKNPLMAKLLEKLGGGRQEGAGAGGAELCAGGSRRTNRTGARGEISLLPAALAPTEVLFDHGRGWQYPEWDTYGGRYRRDWCTALEVSPRPEDHKAFQASPSTELRRRLARLGVGLERRRRQPQGDDLDLDAAVEAQVELLAGAVPGEDLYIESQRRKRSLSVLLLLDISGSVADSSSHGSAHMQQQRAASMLLDALHRVGDRVALYGFRSQGRSLVYLVQVKSFDEPLTGAIRERLGGLAPGGFTRLGAAVRHSTHLLLTKGGTERRLLIVLSDGIPYDDDYEGVYGEEDARRALAEARRQGIGCLCLTLGASTSQKALRRVFGSSAHASGAQLEELINHIGPLFRRALGSADLQRRLAQRHLEEPSPTGRKGVP